MSDVINAAVAALNDKLGGGFDGLAKFVIDGEGAVMVDSAGARSGDDEADVTLTASLEVFEGMMSGEVNPTTAFMTGKLNIAGDMGLAMKLGASIS